MIGVIGCISDQETCLSKLFTSSELYSSTKSYKSSNILVSHPSLIEDNILGTTLSKRTTEKCLLSREN